MTDKRLLTPVKLNLLRAADYIEMYGWYRGDLFDEGSDEATCHVRTKLMPSACALGALRMTAPDSTVRHQALEVLGRYVGVEEPGEIAEWNDDNDTTQDMVVHALRGAAIDD